MLDHGSIGAPTLHHSDHGYTLDVPVEIAEQEREPSEDRVLSVDVGVKKQATAVVVDGTDGQIASPENIDHPSEHKLFRLTTEADGLNDRLAALRNQGKAHTDRFGHLYSEYRHLRQKERRLRKHIQYDVANQLVWLVLKHDCETIVCESLGQMETPNGDGTLACSISTWARGDLLDVVEYKTTLVGIETDSVNPWGTSRHCPRCGERGETVKAPDDHTECRHGGHFHCPNCGSECDRDVAGAINVGRKSPSDSDMEEANPVAYTETGTHASFPSPAVIGACSTGVQSPARQDSARGCQTQLTQYCATETRGGLVTGGLSENQSSNTGRQLPSESVITHILANGTERDSTLPNTTDNLNGTFTTMLKYNCEREGTHFVEVNPAGTTNECASCGVATDKPVGLREHSCPACGFEMDRDASAAINILSRGFDTLGVVHSEATSVKTAPPMFSSDDESDANVKRVLDAGSPTLLASFSWLLEGGVVHKAK